MERVFVIENAQFTLRDNAANLFNVDVWNAYDGEQTYLFETEKEAMDFILHHFEVEEE